VIGTSLIVHPSCLHKPSIRKKKGEEGEFTKDQGKVLKDQGEVRRLQKPDRLSFDGQIRSRWKILKNGKMAAQKKKDEMNLRNPINENKKRVRVD